jgi:ABC-2 type transport system ATP-binding protein
VQNLQNRARGAESVLVEVGSPEGDLDRGAVQRRLEQVAGVSRVLPKDTRGNRSVFEVESLKERSIRADVARAVVESGWDLNELRSATMSLEEVFLQLTGGEKPVEDGSLESGVGSREPESAEPAEPPAEAKVEPVSEEPNA